MLYIKWKQLVSTVVSKHFGKTWLGHTLKANFIIFQTVDLEIYSILVFSKSVWDSVWFSKEKFPHYLVDIYVSQERKELLTWSKKHFSSFLKGFHLKQIKTIFLVGFLVRLWSSFQTNIKFINNKNLLFHWWENKIRSIF